MKKLMKVLFLVSFMSIMSIGNAYTDSTCESNNCECPPEPCPPQPCCDIPPAPTTAAYNQSARLDVCGSWDFNASASFIYWIPSMEQMEIAETNALLTTTNGSIIDMNFKYKPGFKVALGYNAAYDNWTAFLQYTRLNATTSDSVSIGSATNLGNLTTLHLGLPTNNTTEIKTSWKLDYNIFDLEFGRPFYSGECLTINPHFGLRSGWIDHDFKGSDIGTNTFEASNKADSWLIGPRAGIYTNWLLDEGFRFFGNAALSLFYQKFNDVKLSVSVPADLTVANKTISYSISYLNSSMDFLLGLGYGTYFSNNNWHFDLTLGYEMQLYFNQNIMRHAIEMASARGFTKPGNLMLHGLTLSARFDF